MKTCWRADRRAARLNKDLFKGAKKFRVLISAPDGNSSQYRRATNFFYNELPFRTSAAGAVRSYRLHILSFDCFYNDDYA